MIEGWGLDTPLVPRGGSTSERGVSVVELVSASGR
jgi:hypothetical protein